MAAVAFDFSYPYSLNPSSDDAWRDLSRVGIAGNGVCLGQLNELAVTPGSGRQVLVDTGKVWAYGQFGKRSTTTDNLAVTTNTSGQPRIDRVIVRNNFTSKRVELDILTGTPGASPVAPALTVDATKAEFSLAKLACANGYSNFITGNITDERFFRDGSNMAAANAAARDLWLPSPDGGEQVSLRDTCGLYLYDNLTDSWEQLRRETHVMSVDPAGNDDCANGAVWPTGFHIDIAVPEWATRANARAKIGQVHAQTAACDIQLALELGGIIFDSPRFRWDNTLVTTTTEQVIVLEGDEDVSSVAGTTVTFRVLTSIPSLTGVLRADVETTARASIEFR